MIKVSLIAPVYNSESFVKNFIDSVLNQTLSEIEILIVDDCSPDNSTQVIHELIDGNIREGSFRFLKTENNVGPGEARNFALSKALGEYVAFIDSDDWIEPSYCEDLYLTAKKHNCDLCCCQAWMDFEDERPSMLLRNPVNSHGIFNPDAKKSFLTQFVTSHWTFLLRREFLQKNQILYPKERSSEDSFFIIISVLTAESIAEVMKPLYHYIARDASVSNQKNMLRYRDKLNVFVQMLDRTKEISVYPIFKAEIDFIYLKKGFLVPIFDYITSSLKIQSAPIIEIYQNLQENVPDYRHNPYFKKEIKIKILTFMIRIVPRITANLIRFSLIAKKKNWDLFSKQIVESTSDKNI